MYVLLFDFEIKYYRGENNMLSPDAKLQSYFDSLPKIVQESIMQCGMEFKNVDELKTFVDGLNQ